MRFSTRDVILLVLVIGLVVGWWLDRRSQNQKINEAQDNDAVLRNDITILENQNDGLRARIRELESKVVP
jgi:hypothetical protein